MKRAVVFALVPALVLIGGCRPKPVAKPGTERATLGKEESFFANERKRIYFVHGPEDRSGPKRPLVIVLHGRYGSALQIEQDTHFTEAAERAGFVVAYPEGVDRAWHDRRDLGASTRVDDVGFIRTLIERVIAERNVDPKRVYVAGMSNGAMMAFRLACELSDAIAAIGVVAGSLPINGADDCRPKHPMPLVMFAGTQDPFVPYDGGAVARKRGEVLGVEAARDRFAKLNECAPIDATTTFDRMPDETRVTMTAHTHCAENAEVRLYSIAGGGHTWPNGPDRLPFGMAGRTTREIDGAAELLAFFARH